MSNVHKLTDPEQKKQLNKISAMYKGDLGKKMFMTLEGIKSLLVKSKQNKVPYVAELFGINLKEDNDLDITEDTMKLKKIVLGKYEVRAINNGEYIYYCAFDIAKML